MQRTDIHHSDVFISWTGKDRELKNHIIDYLRRNNITCTESDHDCAGDFRQWSREAVGKSTVFLLLYTENTVNSEFVPVEIEELRKLDDYRNRCVPVVTDYSLYGKNLPDLAESESAVVLDRYELAEEHLEKILYNVQTLINNRLCKVYCEATKPTYLRLVSMLKAMRVADREFDHNRLYIDRTVTDENGEEFASAAEFTNTEDIIFLQGPAGSGKSCYIDQLRNAADDQTLVMSLSCRKLVDATDLYSVMFEEFKRYCGNRQFYTSEDFKSLLSVRHLLLVLDGMDEIATEKGTRKFLNIIKDYYDVNSDSTTLFFTSRNESDADLIAMNGQIPRKLILRSLDEDQIRVFGSNLFLMLGSSYKSDDFYVHIQDLADEIRTNPLLLSQLAIVYDKKSEIPQTTVGIYDAVCEITMSREDDVADVPDDYREMVTRRLSDILKSFSAERYRLLSLGKQIDTVKILTVILKNEYTDARERAAFLEEYLQSRAMLVDGEFYHKMLLEYFTATYYYEQCFDDYDEIENSENIKNLFEHYSDPYWSAVLQMFLVKADSLIDGKTTTELYRELMTYGITEYTLLFDTCRDLIRYKEEAQSVLIYDILQKSANGVYPPYGPLFWYVPEYKLYEDLLITLDSVKESDFFTKALALTRDVCWIFGHYNTVDEITDRVNGKVLLEKAFLSGVRQGLCELFFTGSTNSTVGDDIYPRCFNIEEAKSWKENGYGIFGRMPNAFEDEFELYSHEMFNELNGEWLGIVATEYDTEYIESVLPSKSCKKLCGLFLSPTTETEMKKMAINSSHICAVYLPENIELKTHTCFDSILLRISIFVCDIGLIYYRDKLVLPIGVTEIREWDFIENKSLVSITLPDSVDIICDRAFCDCSSLATIILPDGLTKISAGLFDGCGSLVSIILPKSTTEIEDDAFRDCKALVSINILESIKTIGKRAFENCESLSSIILPEGITEIKRATFRGCDSLVSINLPTSLKTIEAHAFSDCCSLVSIMLPDGISEICAFAFNGCASLVSINFPDSITLIDWQAFSGCSSLTEITIPSGITKIGWEAFRDCCSLVSILLPDDMMKIDCAAFLGCSALSSIILTDSITEIGNSAFADCSSLKFVKFSDNLTKIDDYAFTNCNSLTSVSLPDKVAFIGKNVFSGCSQLKSIHNCPLGYNYEKLGVTSDCIINYRDENLQITVPENTTEIIDRQFEQRLDIVQFHVPLGVIRIGVSAFNGCASLTSISFSDGIQEIGDEAFAECAALTSIIFPDSLTNIGDRAFKGCSSIETIILPDNIKEIGGSVFEGCSSLVSIKLSKGITRIGNGVFANCSSLESITLPENINAIGGSAFWGCRSLATINLPDGLTKICVGLFDGCGSLTSIMLPESIIEIEDVAFRDCKALVSINIPESIKIIGRRAFENCESLLSIKIPDGVTRIGYRAFSGCNSLASIILPEGVTEFEPGVFRGCSSLASIILPESITEIECASFSGCSSLASIILPENITQIGPLAFCRCSSLISITLPESITKISSSAFESCNALSSITLPKNIAEIGRGVFKGCNSLASIILPEGITKIERVSFSGCSSLTSINIPDAVTEICRAAFEGCSSLQSIEIPPSVRIVGDDAFKNCTSLREITISRRFEDDLSRIFSGVDLSDVKINWL